MKTVLTFWRGRIEAAKQRGRFDYKDLDLAFKWNTCAISERKGFVDAPRSKEEDKLGARFYYCVVDSDFDGAIRTIEQIEALAE